MKKTSLFVFLVLVFFQSFAEVDLILFFLCILHLGNSLLKTLSAFTNIGVKKTTNPMSKNNLFIMI